MSVAADGALLALASTGDRDGTVHEALELVVATLRRAAVDVVSGYSPVGRDPGDHVDAARALRTLVGATDEPGAVLSLPVHGLLGFLVHDDALRFARRAGRDLLAPLVAHDATADSNLVQTLRAFLDANGQIRDAARSLDVHANTVRYRLGRIRELSRIDPYQVDSLLEARLALRVGDLP